LDGDHDALGVGGELLLVGKDEGVETFKGLGLGQMVALCQGAQQEFVVGGV
jgi:hypothetical protein